MPRRAARFCTTDESGRKRRNARAWASVCSRDDSIADVTVEASARQPLSALAEDERLFRDSLAEFAEREIRPLVRPMDEQAQLDSGLIARLFELGAMAIEAPDALGGGGGTFFHSVLAVEELSRVDPSVGVLVDVQ